MSPKHKEKPIFTVRILFIGTFPLNMDEDTMSAECAHKYLVRVLANPNNKEKQKMKLHMFEESMTIHPAKLFVNSQQDKKSFPYKFVRRFFIFKAAPQNLVLGFASNQTLPRFLILQFSSVNELNKVCDQIDKARKSFIGPRDELLTVDSNRPMSIMLANNNNLQANLPPTEIVTFNGNRPPNNLFHETIVEVNNDQISRTKSNASSSSSSSSSPSSSKKSIEQQQNVNELELFPKIVRVENAMPNKKRHSSSSSSSSNSSMNRFPPPPPPPHYHKHNHQCVKKTSDGNCDDWEVSEVHISYDPKDGPKICEDGPIYMYSAHQKHATQVSVFTCETSSISSDDEFNDDHGRRAGAAAGAGPSSRSNNYVINGY